MVLVVDDSLEYAQMVAELLRSEAAPGASVQVATSYERALRSLDEDGFDVALVDYWLGAQDGLGLLKAARERGLETPFIIMTGRGDEEVAVDAMKAGAADYLGKAQLSGESLGSAIRHAIALHGHQHQRRLAEHALRASEERFRALVENSSDALLLLDAEGRVTYATPSTERQFGWSAAVIVGKSILDLLHPDDRPYAAVRLSDVLDRAGEPVTAEARCRRADGSWRAMETVSVNRLSDPGVGAVVVNARDVTERRRLEEELRQSQKMEAIGRLAGGVAHDFNNLLTAILGYCNLVLDEMPLEHPLRSDLEEIRVAGDRAASLTKQLLAFSRRQVLEPQAVDLNRLVRQMEKMLRRLLGEDIELVTELGGDLASIQVDATSIEQVLINLAVNARDAMPGGGRLTISTSAVDFARGYTSPDGVIAPGRYLVLAVGDTGEGMDAATRSRVFEPFFTTKQLGKGTGLGLATVYGIVQQNGGHISLTSEPSRGTVFTVFLPAAAASPLVVDFSEAKDESSLRGWETVLIVEDEDAVRALAREVLRRHGYIVLDAKHGVDALRVAERHRDPIHLLVTDLVMPHMSGRDLAQRLLETRPDMKILFMSGYTDHADLHEDRTRGIDFLQKPFTPGAFASRVRSLLAAQKTPRTAVPGG